MGATVSRRLEPRSDARHPALGLAYAALNRVEARRLARNRQGIDDWEFSLPELRELIGREVR